MKTGDEAPATITGSEMPAEQDATPCLGPFTCRTCGRREKRLTAPGQLCRRCWKPSPRRKQNAEYRKDFVTVNLRRDAWEEIMRVAALNHRSGSDELDLAARFWTAGVTAPFSD